MTSLNTYLKDVERLARDTRQGELNLSTIIEFVNRARREVAMRAQCIRRLTPISGSVVSCSVTNAGSGYTAPTLTISPPDFPSATLPQPNGLQATALPIILGGSIAAIDIQNGGYGYWQPTISISDPTGSGAAATLFVTSAGAGVDALNVTTLNEGQEVYSFSDIDLGTMFPGVGEIYLVKSVAVIFASYRYVLPCYAFTTYQALIRSYAQQMLYVPAVCAQYGQGTTGSLYLYPVPSQSYQMEWDALCLPSDLVDDQSEEAIPAPWTDAVVFYALHLAYLSLQNFNVARMYLDLYTDFVHRYSAYARPGRVTNPYGRW